MKDPGRERLQVKGEASGGALQEPGDDVPVLLRFLASWEGRGPSEGSGSTSPLKQTQTNSEEKDLFLSRRSGVS